MITVKQLKDMIANLDDSVLLFVAKDGHPMSNEVEYVYHVSKGFYDTESCEFFTHEQIEGDESNYDKSVMKEGICIE